MMPNYHAKITHRNTSVSKILLLRLTSRNEKLTRNPIFLRHIGTPLAANAARLKILERRQIFFTKKEEKDSVLPTVKALPPPLPASLSLLCSLFSHTPPFQYSVGMEPAVQKEKREYKCLIELSNYSGKKEKKSKEMKLLCN